MANDLLTEDPQPLGELARLLPSGQAGKRVHRATLWRWCLRGCRRHSDGATIRLEHIRVGAVVVSSEAALRRFFAALTGPATDTTVSPPLTPTAKRRAAERANEKLAAVLG